MKKGFTLIELLVVVIILGILIAIAIPRYYQGIDSSKVQAQKTNIKLMQKALEVVATQRADKTYPAAPSSNMKVADWINSSAWPGNFKDYFDQDLIDPWTGHDLWVVGVNDSVAEAAAVKDAEAIAQILDNKTYNILYVGFNSAGDPVAFSSFSTAVYQVIIPPVTGSPNSENNHIVHYCLYYFERPNELKSTCGDLSSPANNGPIDVN